MALVDQVGVVDSRSASAELDELLRPLRATFPTKVVSESRGERLWHAEYPYVCELRMLDNSLPEGVGALPRLFTDLLDGVSALRGPVELEMRVSPFAREAPEKEADGSRRVRAVRFTLRISSTSPIPAALRARAEGLCLASEPETSTWCSGTTASLDSTEGGSWRPASSDTAALTLGLLPLHALDPASITGRPVEGAPTEGPVVGVGRSPGGRRVPWRLSWDARRHHVLLAGASGCGKTTTMRRMILDDLKQGRSPIVVDPHGDLFDDIKATVGDSAVLVDPRAGELSAPLDLLDPDPRRAASHLVSAMAELWPREFVGPVWHRSILLSLQVLAETGGNDAFPGLERDVTIATLERFLTEEMYRETLIGQLPEGNLKEAAERESRAWVRDPEYDLTSTGWLASKLAPMTGGPLAPLFSRAASQSFEALIADRRPVVIALPVGLSGTQVTQLIGRMLLTRLTTAIAGQVLVPRERRTPCAVYIDEAHLLVGGALSGLLAQARKFNTSVCVATQVPSQMEDQLGTVLANAQTLLLGRLPRNEADCMLERVGRNGVGVLPTLPRYHQVAVPEDNDPNALPLLLAPAPMPQ